jgi:preprotein translocase subunit SecD
MIQIQRWKIIAVTLLCIWGLLYAIPSFLPRNVVEQFPRWLHADRISLGLDLQGGSHLLLEVDTRAVRVDRLQNIVDDVRVTFRNQRINYTDLGVDGDAVSVRLRDLADREKALSALRGLDPNATVAVSPEGVARFTYTEKAWEDRYASAIQQSLEIVRRRIDETGTREPTIVRHGKDRILVQLPGVDDPERIKRLLGTTAKMTFHLVDGRANMADIESNRAPAGSIIVEFDKADAASGRREKIAVQRRVAVSGENLTDAQPTISNGEPVVSFRFDAIGARKFGEITTENVNKPFAILLDNRVISAPNIREPILGGSGIITGGFTVQTANELALLLRAGALPAPLKVLEERTVGPDLGSDSIKAGTIAIVIGYALIAILMLVGYGLFGIFANVTLILNIAFTIAIMAALGATLTLPGLAGMVLGLAMAVDANVLIYERIREEERQGRSPFPAVDVSFQRAYVTILDSNLTTLIAAMFLYALGSGPVRGFAVTLGIGIACSMLTAVTVTRMMIVGWLKWAKPKQLPI